jgi:hypothetical protein
MMFLLCLIAALAGSPLRQAEAAGDLARSLAELDGGDVIEVIDGGVGDDAGESILTTGGRARAGATSEPPAIDHGPFPPRASTESLPPGDADSRSPHPAGPLTSDPARRYAWLQAFRF